METHFYKKWKHKKDLPIECLINMMLLLRDVRSVIQFDISYYTDENVKQNVIQFVNSCFTTYNIVVHEDSLENIIIYLEKNKVKIEKKLCKIGKGVLENAFRTSKFADVLDKNFYETKGRFPFIFKKKRISQVSFQVFDQNKSGVLLTKMCSMQIGNSLPALYKYFVYLSKEIESIDSTLQTSFTIHTKPGLWKKSAELIIDSYRVLHVL